MILIILIVVIVGLFLLYHKQRDDKTKIEDKLFSNRKLPLDTYEEELDMIFDYSKVRIVPLEGSIDGESMDKEDKNTDLEEKNIGGI